MMRVRFVAHRAVAMSAETDAARARLNPTTATATHAALAA